MLNGADTRSLYDYNAQTKQYSITKKNISNIVRLTDFVANKKDYVGYVVEMTFTVVALPKCYDRTADVIDDTNWSATLQHMSAVAEYLVGQDITPPYTHDGTNTTSIVGIDDPLCTTQSCVTNTNPKNAETQSV